MTKIGRDQVMMASEWIGRGLSQRTVARQLGVSEATLRYRRQRAATDAGDGRRDRRSALDGFEPAVTSALEDLVDPRRPERPVAARLVFDALVRDHGYAGSYPALVRYLRRLRGVPPVRALRRVETPPGGKVERRVRVWHAAAAPLFARAWPSLAALQAALDARADALHARLRCPMTGTSVAEAFATEQATLLPLPALGEAFDCIVARRVSRDCLVHFEGRQYSVPFAWVGREVEILGTVDAVVIRGAGGELARHPRHTAERLVLDAAHYDGPATAGVLPPPPLGARARQQMARHAGALPRVVARPLADYVTRIDALCREGGR